ncbi:MAG: hypothetical protein OEW83_16930 [Acidimicrobiia bacterium]|nr:hypothetical protein [Acidimicrobiia bacterium]
MSGEFVFGVDLDGVCADYHIGFRDVVAAELGVEPESLARPPEWGYGHWGIEADDFNRLHKLAVTEKRMLRNLPVMDGCPDALWRLSDLGVWIRIITHRLYVNWGHAVTVSDTVDWLDEHRIPYRDICFLGDKPQVGADAYIDDAPHNIDALRRAGHTVIVFDQPYNRHFDGPRAASWHEVEEIVSDLAARSAVRQPQLPGLDAGADRLDRFQSGEPSGR